MALSIRTEFPRVYPIADSGAVAARGMAIEEFAAALLDGGAQILQFRHKQQFGRQAFAAASALGALCASAGARLVINDRADIARILDAGVHLGQDDLSPAGARRVAPDAFIGHSTHNEAQLRAGGREPVNYLAIGPIFSTTSKERPDPVVGIEGLRALRPLTEKPLVAIGGITRENARAVLDAGADSIAVIGDLLPPDPSYRSVRARMEEWLTLTRK